MKHAKKMASILMALVMVMVFGLSTTVFASGTGTITINNATAGNTYKVYKVFDAIGDGKGKIVYTVKSGKTEALPSCFELKSGTNNIEYKNSGTSQPTELTAADIAAIAAYVTESDLVETATATGTSVEISGLDNGYYYITTTTGTAVTITSTNPNAAVSDKNNPPVLDKKITGVTDGSLDTDGKKALAEVGTTVNFTATIEVKKGAENYVFHDTMSAGLSYNERSLSVKVNSTEVAAANYDKTTATGDTITLAFTDAWIKTQVGKTITITYNATVTSDALSVNAATNTAKVDYGHNDQVNTTPVSENEVYNAKFTVTKTDNSNQPLAGAGFVIAKTVGSDTVYYFKNKDGVSWVNDITNATELKTTDDASGNVLTFTGLANGTYKLIETTVPDGYSKVADQKFTIAEHNYEKTNLEQAATVVNNAGSVLPTTGGMGTTIFYITGAILAVGAAVLLIVRRRMKAEKQAGI